ncbi:MAG: Crp/Fnr family transcriptional regulator [Bacteroidota bacterium]
MDTDIAFEQILQLIQQQIEVKEEDFAQFAQECRQIRLKKKEIWQAAGEIGQSLAFINQGILRQFYTRDGDEKTDDFYAEGEFVGNYVSYLQQRASRMSIQALSDCQLLVIDFEALQRLYQLSPSVERFARLVAEQKLISLHERTAGFLLDSPQERYDQLLIEKPNIHARVPLYLIAQYLGIHPESLSRIRARKTSKN